jgi:hypothetical protein
MSMLHRPLMAHRLATRSDGGPIVNPPPALRIVLAGLVAAAVSLVADIILVAIGTAAFHPPASFGKFAFATYAILTAIVIVGATGFWSVVVRVTSRG